MKKYLLLTAPLFIFSSCLHWGKRVRGDGNIQAKEVTVSSFNELHVSGSVSVYILQGDLKPVKIEADENLLPYIEVKQDGDELTIKNKDDFDLISGGDMKIYITAPSFHSIELSGAGDILTENPITNPDPLELDLSGAGDIKMDISAPKLTAQISGVGSIYLKGVAVDADFDVSGAGSAHCYGLTADNVSATISGVGSAEVHADKKLEADVSGVGSIHYKGNATDIDQHVSGAGSVSKE